MKFSKDLKLLGKSLDYVWDKKLTFIFKNKSLLRKVLILTFDKHRIYILTKSPLVSLKNPQNFPHGYFLYKLNHNIPLGSEDFRGWWNGIKRQEFLSYLPKDFTNQSQLLWPRVSGPLPSLFLAHHAELKRKNYAWDPYSTPESYMATIIHEFAHAYFDAIYLPWHGIKHQNLEILDNALKLFSGEKINIKDVNTISLFSSVASEIFAFCTEYFSSSLFWPRHKEAIDKEFQNAIPLLIKEEQNIDLNLKASILDRETHLPAAIFGKIIIAN